MTISRANMEKQVAYGKKKKVKKMIGGGELLGSISPLAGAITGKGILGRAMGKGLKNVSPLAALIDASKKKKKGSASPAADAAPQAGAGMGADMMQGMSKMYGGGAVKKKRDGIAIKGKTKGRMC
jgi:hypothetical protein